MRLRSALYISAGALTLSFVLPGLRALGVLEILTRIRGVEGWAGLAYLAAAFFVRDWTQGMLWGVALLAPLSAGLERLAPHRVHGRTVLICLLALWILPAMPLAHLVQPALANFRLIRPKPSECIAGVSILSSSVNQRGGSTAIVGNLSNMGTLRLSSLEAEFVVRPAPGGPDKEEPARTVFCDVVQRESWDPPAAPPVKYPSTTGGFRCEVPEVEVGGAPPTAEFVRFKSWSCVELGDRRYN